MFHSESKSLTWVEYTVHVTASLENELRAVAKANNTRLVQYGTDRIAVHLQYRDSTLYSWVERASELNTILEICNL